MKPSIGRIVLVAFEIRGVLVERPAVITSTAVRYGATVVNAFVFLELGDEVCHGIVPFMSCLPHTPDGAPRAAGCWRWPPRGVKPEPHEDAAPQAVGEGT